MKNLFSYNDYRSFLNDHLNNVGVGAKKRSAAQMGISASLLSQILNGERTLSLDQAYKFALKQTFNSFEKLFWIGLVEFENAGTAELKTFFKERIVSMREEAAFKSRSTLGLKRTTWSKEFVAIFYSSWHFPAVYCLLGLADQWTHEQIAERLNLPLERVRAITAVFSKHEITAKRRDGLVALRSKGYVYLDSKDTEMHAASVLHNCKNFRQLAMSKFEEHQFDSGAHGDFRTVVALVSEEQFKDLRNEMSLLMRKLNDHIASAQGEKIVCLNIDLFGI